MYARTRLMNMQEADIRITEIIPVFLYTQKLILTKLSFVLYSLIYNIHSFILKYIYNIICSFTHRTLGPIKR